MNVNTELSTCYLSSQAGFGIEIFKYLSLQDPDWDYTTYNFTGYEKEIRYAAAYLDATSTNYSGFKNRKGKIIIWHGWSDPALSAYTTNRRRSRIYAVKIYWFLNNHPQYL